MKSLHRASRLAGLLVWTVAAACAEGAPAGGDGPQVRDSAGVRLVTSRLPDQGLPPFASLTPEPTLVLAPPTGSSWDPVGAAALAGGGVAVADAAARALLFHAGDGTLQSTWPGAAPDAPELLDLSGMGWAGGDTVWVADSRGGQVALVNAAGLQVRDTFPPTLSVAGRFGDGAYLLVPAWSTSLLGEDAREGLRRDTATWARWWPREGRVEQVGRFPYDEVMVVARDSGVVVAEPPFGRRTSRAVAGDGFWVGTQESFEIRRFGAGGALAEVVRVEGVDLKLTEALKEAVRPPRSEGDTALVDRLWAGAPATRPAHARLVASRDGTLWAAEHVAGNEPPRNWLVFSPAGEPLGLVSVPGGFFLLEAGGDWVLGVDGALGARRVVRYGLVRGG